MSTPRSTVLSAFTLRRVCRARTGWRLVASLAGASALLTRPTAASEPSPATELAAQRTDAPSESPDPSVYFTGAVGASTAGPAVRGLATVARGHWFIGLGAGYSEELFPGKSPALMLVDIGPLVGLHGRTDYFAGAVGVGLSYVHAINRGRYLEDSDGWFVDAVYEKLDEHTIGVPWMTHGMIHCGVVGLGAVLFGNMNAALTGVGAAGTLNLGVI